MLYLYAEQYVQVIYVTIIFDELYLKHEQSFMHPERPERLEAIVAKMKKESLWNNVIKPRSATNDDVLLNHSQRYIDRVRDSAEGYIDPDTYLRKGTYEIAMRAVGGGMEAATRGYDNKESVLSLVRPPGHHAMENSSMGFCYFNNIAIAARKIRDKAKRIAIVDPDVHHGNGTQDSFYDSSDVLYISTHQKYIFPGTGHESEVGRGEGKGYTVNIPFESGCGDASYDMALQRIIKPVLKEFDPDMILVSLGTDAHYEDMLAGLSLSSEGHVNFARDIWQLGQELCDGRFAVFLEGGYALSPLSEIVTAIYGLSQGKEVALKNTDIADSNCRGKRTIESVLAIQRKYWDI